MSCAPLADELNFLGPFVGLFQCSMVSAELVVRIEEMTAFTVVNAF
jgi:hypothetical protein